MAEQRSHTESERFHVKLAQYRQWLAEFPDVALVLDNLAAEVEGKQALCASHPPSENGPWTVVGLRETLRRRHRTDDGSSGP